MKNLLKKLKDFNEISKRSNSLNLFMLNTELDIQLVALLQMEDRSYETFSRN